MTVVRNFHHALQTELIIPIVWKHIKGKEAREERCLKKMMSVVVLVVWNCWNPKFD